MNKVKCILIVNLILLCGGANANGQHTANAVNIPNSSAVVSETPAEPAMTTKPALQPDVVAASVPAVVTYVHTDVLGSVIAETNASGVVIKTTNYKPFGESKDN